MDNLDELERRVTQHPEVIAPYEVTMLIERCRKAEAARDECERQFQAKVEELAVEIGLRNQAERNLACIADMLNTWARETNQREVTDYLGPCVLRDALKEMSGAANKREYELRARLARWPEAVAKVREAHPMNLGAHVICDEIVAEATAHEAGKEE